MGKVLLVDDDVELSSMLREYILREGFEVDAEHDGEAGVRAALSGGYGIVVLDVMMPGMGGIEALRRIRAAWCCRRIRWWRWMGRHWASRTPRRKRSRCCPCCPGGGIRCTQACAPWMRRAWFISGS